MKNLKNPVSEELGVTNMFVCVMCYRTHLCDMGGDCDLTTTQEGFVCTKTGFVYQSMMPACPINVSEPVAECNVDDVNVVNMILSYVYAFLVRHAENYADVLEEVMEDGKFKKRVEDAVYFTFNKVFEKTQNLHRVPLSVIGQLFIQLIIGVHTKVTKYDSMVIKVSRRKREDGLLKQMRCEYGNAPLLGH